MIYAGFFFNDTATTEIYTLSLHGRSSDLPITVLMRKDTPLDGSAPMLLYGYGSYGLPMEPHFSIRSLSLVDRGDRKSTRLNSSHANISYAVFCLKKKKPRTSL